MCFKRFFLIIFVTFFFLFLPKQQSLNYVMAASDPGAYVIEITKNAINTLTDESINQKKKVRAKKIQPKKIEKKKLLRRKFESKL